MYELIQVTERCYYLQSPAKIGLVRLSDEEVCLIDSGSDKSAAKAVRKLLQANHWSLRAIYNTHSHADHIGGNQYLQAHTACRIYAPGIECAFTKHPILEPSYLYGGHPGAELRGKFLLAAPSEAEQLEPEHLPTGFSTIPLPGHSFDMVGYRTADDVVYLADSLCSQATLQKYRICFLCDVAAHLRTLEALQHMSARCFVPAHADVASDVADLARYNADQVLETAHCICQLCRTPLTAEELLTRLFDTYKLTLTHEQHALVGSTVRSYLTWLSSTGRVQSDIADNRLYWVASVSS